MNQTNDLPAGALPRADDNQAEVPPEPDRPAGDSPSQPASPSPPSMIAPTPPVPNKPTPQPQLQDAVALWASQAGHVRRPPLLLVKLDNNERVVVLFTASIARVEIHFVDGPALRGYVQCNGAGCLLCRIGRSHDLRDLLPVYDVANDEVTVLAVSPSIRPGALQPLLIPLLQLVLEGAKIMIAVSRDEGNRYIVDRLDITPAIEVRAATAIAAFERRLATGQVDLASCYQATTNASLARLQTVKLLMEARGITL